MDAAFLIPAFFTFFVVMDPPGLASMFVALTQGMDAHKRRVIALRACLVAGGVLFAFAALGEQLLDFIGISMPAFRIAGGILLFLIALDMLFERRTKRREDRAEQDDHDDPSVFPLAIPLIAGPATIATVILLTGQQPGWGGFSAVLGVMFGVLVLNYICFLASGMIDRLLGRTGVIVLTRILGMLLAALSVQFVLDGLKSFGFAG